MPLMYDPKKIKYATPIEGDSLTEQEHADSCDINKMLKNAARGLDVRGGGSTEYGYDDTTMTGLQFRQEKARLEAELEESAKAQEYLEEELNHIPPEIRKKFGFKTKNKNQSPIITEKRDDPNDAKNPVAPSATPETQKPAKSP